MPDVTKQCSSKDLLASLLFDDNKFMLEHVKTIRIDELEAEKMEIYSENSNILKNKNKCDVSVLTAVEYVELKAENNVEKLIEEIANHKLKLVSFQTDYKNTNSKLHQVRLK